jgi:hypothetical protein
MNIQQRSTRTMSDWLKKSRSDQFCMNKRPTATKKLKEKMPHSRKLRKNKIVMVVIAVCLFFVYGLVHKWHPCWLVKDAKAIADSQHAVQSMTSAMGCRWGQSM